MTAGSVGLYGPVQEDLARVETTLFELAQIEFPWLAALVEQVLRQPGKRMRPAITLLAGSFCNYNLDRLVPMAAAAELLHTATLVHDDMLDGALRRRGAATLNSTWNAGTTVIVGDYLFAHSAELVSRTGSVRAMKLFAQTLAVVCHGELSQGFSAFDPDITRDEYYVRIGRKTAQLFAMAAETGAHLSDAPDDVVQALQQYGWNLGMAFQIADDILDFTGSESEMGKPVGSDLLNGILTLPSLLYMERFPDGNPIRDLFEQRNLDGNHQRIVDVIQTSDIIDDCFRVAEGYRAAARAALSRLPVNGSRRTLEDLTDYVLERRS